MARKIITAIVVCVLCVIVFFFALKYISSMPQASAGASEPEQTATVTTDTADATTSETTIGTTAPVETTVPTQPEESTQSTEQKEAKPKPTEQAPTKETQNNTQSEPTQTQTQPTDSKEQLPVWKTLYSGYVQVYRSKYDHYSLIYVDNDDIPELYMYSKDKSELCAVRNDVMISKRLDGFGGGNYHAKSGNFMNVYVENDSLIMRVYRLTDHFPETFYGREDKSVDPPLYYIGNYTNPVSEKEYIDAVSQFIDVENVSFMHENALTYDAVLKELSS